MDTRKLAALLGGILAVGMAVAQPGMPGNPPAQRGGSGGHGMTGGGGMGLGAWRDLPDLTQDQRSKIEAIRRDLRNRQFALMDQMQDQRQNAPAYHNGQFDEQAVRRAYDAIEKLRRQMFENSLDAQKRVDALLTPAQRQHLSGKSGQ
jgi:Spy/CpxP family protein refolding chaperone